MFRLREKTETGHYYMPFQGQEEIEAVVSGRWGHPEQDVGMQKK